MQQEDQKIKSLNTCGRTVDDMLKSSKDILEMSRYLFSGFQCTLHSLMARKFFNSHTFHFGKLDPSIHQDEEHVDLNLAWYSFGAFYKDDKQTMSGKVSAKGTNASYNYKDNRLRVNFKGTVSVLPYFEADVACKLHDFWIEAKFSNTAFGLGFTTPVTQAVSFGSELLISPVSKVISKRYLIQHKNKDIGETSSLLFTGVGEKKELELLYSKKLKANIRFLSALQFHLSQDKQWSSNWYFGYSCKSKILQLRSLIDGNGSVSSIIEFPLAVFMHILLSGKINYKKNDYDFGFGVSMNI